MNRFSDADVDERTLERRYPGVGASLHVALGDAYRRAVKDHNEPPEQPFRVDEILVKGSNPIDDYLVILVPAS